MAVKYATGYFTTAANASQQSFTLQTPDDQFQRQVVAIYSNLPTTGINVELTKAGQQMLQVDGLRFAAGNMVVDCDVTFPGGLNIGLLLQDLAGAAHVNWGITIKYVTPNQ